MNFITDTGVRGCGIRFEKNHVGRWAAFPLLNITEQSDGLSPDECVRLADALYGASRKVEEMNRQEGTEMLFEGAD